MEQTTNFSFEASPFNRHETAAVPIAQTAHVCLPTPKTHFVGWDPILGQDNAFYVSPADSALQGESSRLEARLLDKLVTPEQKDVVRRQIRLLDILEASCTRKVVAFDLQSSPAFVVSQLQAKKLSDFDGLPVTKRLQAAEQLLEAVEELSNVGLLHGELTAEAVSLQGDQIQLDYLSRFYGSFDSGIQPTKEKDLADTIRIIAECLSENACPEILEFLGGQQRAQYRRLIKEEIDLDNALELAELWNSFFNSVRSIRPIEKRKHASEAKSFEATQEAVDSTCEVEISNPIAADSTDGIDAEATGEIDVVTKNSSDLSEELSLFPGATIGRFELEKELGQGAMGVVYLATDRTNGEKAAVKVLRPTSKDLGQSIRRFNKEARLLAGVQNDHVTRMIETGHDKGFHFMAMEFVDGTTLKDWMSKHPPLDEVSALRIIADIARGLTDAHDQEIVHRDLKPENVLLGRRANDQKQLDASQLELGELNVKLSDFGIARSIDQSASMEVTRAGTLLGTPIFMSPEQCKGSGGVVPASDVYSLGITLYTLLVGEPPFKSTDPMKLAAAHCFEPAPAIRKRCQCLSDEAEQLLNRMLAKDPSHRPSDASQLLFEIETLLRGDAKTTALNYESRGSKSTTCWERVFQWKLDSSPADLWPYVSNTDRLNRAAGLLPVEYRLEKNAQSGLERFGKFRLAGLTIEWREHPYEWVEGQRLGVFREFSSGPFRWFVSDVELEGLPDGGSVLKHTVRIEPRNVLGRAVATIEAGWKGGRALDRIYRRIDKSLKTQHLQEKARDAFEGNASLNRTANRRLEERIEKMLSYGVDLEVAEAIDDFMRHAAPQSLAQIRPLELAEQLQLPSERVIDACLVAAKCRLFQLRWDVLCPTCRVPAGNAELLSEINKHSECEACDTEFQSDLAQAIELVFESHPDIRKADNASYCIGGPGHSPHVVTQLVLAAGDRTEINLPLLPGDYLLRSTSLPNNYPVRCRSQAAPSTLDLAASQFDVTKHTAIVRAGNVRIKLTNDLSTTQVFRFERTIARQNVLTAAVASALPRFREFFPEQVFDRNHTIAAEEITLLGTRLSQIDRLYEEASDAEAYTLVQEALALIEDCVAAHRGAVIKSIGEFLLASFRNSSDAVTASREIERRFQEHPSLANHTTTSAVHRGPLLMATQNGRLDYFGTAVRLVESLCRVSGKGVTLTDSIFSDVEVRQILAENPADGGIQLLETPGHGTQLVQRFLVAGQKVNA